MQRSPRLRTKAQYKSRLSPWRRKRRALHTSPVRLVILGYILYLLVIGIVVVFRRLRGCLVQSRYTAEIRAYTYVVCESAYIRAQDLMLSTDVVLSAGRLRSLHNDTIELFKDLADHIFIICLQCASIRLPDSLLSKTTFVQADRLDRCLRVDHLAHYVKVTLTHAHIIERALLMSPYSRVGIIEEDVLSLAQSPEIRTETGLTRSLKMQQWEVVRLGYKPYFFVDSKRYRSALRLSWSCPSICKCTRFHRNACVMRLSGCDMRSSDAYILAPSSFQSTIDRVKSTGGIIDVHILQSISPQVFILPQLTFQESQPERLQMHLAAKFDNLCVKT